MRLIPSRLAVKLPANAAEQVETARKSYHRFGQFSIALDRIRDELPATPHIVRLVQFIEASKRGICGPPRTGEDVRDDAPDDQGERVF